ncbi:hypothetical protein [Pseudothermotoga sp.]|uniref:hypothetical protein n=1 Tax=Pseudothermotoga sp. TaxID=2033661 RepID=UPI002582927F|nr:hypothetical protein [Pseudothermotoga sp.]MDK2885353.1 hypothetical protein [Pseudothermotoga sp.]
MRNKLSWIAVLTIVVLLLVFYRITNPGELTVQFKCSERLRESVGLSLEKLDVPYREKDSGQIDMIVFDDKIIYSDQIYRLTWNSELAKQVEDMVLSFIIERENVSIKTKSFPFVQMIEITFANKKSTFVVKPKDYFDFNNIVYVVIKSILGKGENVFENGYLLIPLSVEEIDGDISFSFDAKNSEAVLSTESGGK